MTYNRIELSSEEIELAGRILAERFTKPGCVPAYLVRRVIDAINDRRKDRAAELDAAIEARERAGGHVSASTPERRELIAAIRKRRELEDHLLAIPDNPSASATAGPFVAGASNREVALSLAVSSRDSLSTADDIVATAEAFEKFLSR